MITKVKPTSIALYNTLLDDLRGSKELSKILPSVLMLAKQIKNSELEKWAELELNSYFNSNKALTKEVEVPEYRSVPGKHFDIYRRPLHITDPNLSSMINTYRLRNSISELEELARKNEPVSIQDPDIIEIIKDNLGVDVYAFTFSHTAINAILDAIKTNLINKLSKLEEMFEDTSPQQPTDDQRNRILKDVEKLHPTVQAVATKLFLDGHYRAAILDTYITLVDEVKKKSGRHDLDGVALMQAVFSAHSPIIKISDDHDERLGFMWLFNGAVMGIRNPKAHRLIQQNDPQRTLEWLSFASVLFKVLDEGEIVQKP